jgi:hypothetical protein
LLEQTSKTKEGVADAAPSFLFLECGSLLPLSRPPHLASIQSPKNVIPNEVRNLSSIALSAPAEKKPSKQHCHPEGGGFSA